ncbi:hypothetical protein HCA89_11115 [Listeria innocua]|uniref:Uncharacterized protein n=1 Tax=Listeria innocua TaxID=1642 RepID=A0AB73H9N1_LISIO|nr:hypothetical protein [Listeria innocua]
MGLKIGEKIIIKSRSKRDLENAVYQFILDNPDIKFEFKLILDKNIFGRLKWICEMLITKI